jgi:hypothetical protein
VDTKGGKGTGLGEFMGKENDDSSSARSALFGLADLHRSTQLTMLMSLEQRNEIRHDT